ncbi:hypothetical protein TRFO_43054 [Tritrichomonas foetus]|uniref:Ras-GEF domain-containing protein n=1 Tax=Tritrichomonas foetus TaxID=1144522 RepID=A0A1J4KTI6_9EUKA|nr:hypothetical protein TRFO_43054 [Tritrichomonas foetus]|eukprot:OHT14450.1 hypothetical protein TRFO_43054 [Tritrichomonas foetus]
MNYHRRIGKAPVNGHLEMNSLKGRNSNSADVIPKTHQKKLEIILSDSDDESFDLPVFLVNKLNKNNNAISNSSPFPIDTNSKKKKNETANDETESAKKSESSKKRRRRKHRVEESNNGNENSKMLSSTANKIITNNINNPSNSSVNSKDNSSVVSKIQANPITNTESGNDPQISLNENIPLAYPRPTIHKVLCTNLSNINGAKDEIYQKSLVNARKAKSYSDKVTENTTKRRRKIHHSEGHHNESHHSESHHTENQHPNVIDTYRYKPLLNESEPCSLDYYFMSSFQQQFHGKLIAKCNNNDFTPKFLESKNGSHPPPLPPNAKSTHNQIPTNLRNLNYIDNIRSCLNTSNPNLINPLIIPNNIHDTPNNLQDNRLKSLLKNDNQQNGDNEENKSENKQILFSTESYRIPYISSTKKNDKSTNEKKNTETPDDKEHNLPEVTINIDINNEEESNESESEDIDERDSSFMANEMTNNFLDSYNPTLYESQMAFRETNLFLNPPLQHTPSIASFDKVNKETDQDTIITTVFNNNKPIDNESDTSLAPQKRNIPRPTINSVRRRSKQLQLSELENNSLRSTDPNLLPMWNKIRDQLYQESQQERRAQDAVLKKAFIDYSLTTLYEPGIDNIKLIQRDGKNYIDTIEKETFLEFKFGSDINEPYPDHLHLYTWHNLNICSVVISSIILKHMEKINENEERSKETFKSVLQYLLLWIFYFSCDFIENKENVDNVNNILKLIVKKTTFNNDMNDQFVKYTGIIRFLIDSLYTKKYSPDVYTWQIRKPMFSYSNNTQQYNLFALKVDIPTVVKHLTYIELDILHNIQRSEFMHKNWMSEEKNILSPNFVKISNRFNDTACFIASSIMVENPRARAKKIAYWIEAMEEARKQKSYQLLFEIDAALSCCPINRLQATWKLVNKNAIKKFNHLHHITNPIHKYILKYKAEVFEDPKNTVPFIGPFLTELVYIYEGNHITKQLPNGKDGYNMVFQKAYFDTISYIFQDWGSEIQFNLDSKLLNECKLLIGKFKSTHDLLLPSITFEKPRPNEAEFIQNHNI